VDNYQKGIMQDVIDVLKAAFEDERKSVGEYHSLAERASQAGDDLLSIEMYVIAADEQRHLGVIQAAINRVAQELEEAAPYVMRVYDNTGSQIGQESFAYMPGPVQMGHAAYAISTEYHYVELESGGGAFGPVTWFRYQLGPY